MTSLLRGLVVSIMSVLLHAALIGQIPLPALSAPEQEPQIQIGADTQPVVATESETNEANVAGSAEVAAPVTEPSIAASPSDTSAAQLTDTTTASGVPADTAVASVITSESSAALSPAEPSDFTAPIAGSSTVAAEDALELAPSIASPSASVSTVAPEVATMAQETTPAAQPSQATAAPVTSAMEAGSAPSGIIESLSSAPSVPVTASQQSATASVPSETAATPAAPQAETSTAATVAEPEQSAIPSQVVTALPVTEAPADAQVAMLTNPPPDVADHRNAIRAFFERSGSAPCFLATPRSVQRTSAAGLAFAGDPASVAAFETAFHSAIDAELALAPAFVASPQCPAIDLTRLAGGNILTVSLPRDTIPDGGTLAAQAEAPAAGFVHLFLVDDDGLATDITSLARKRDGQIRVEIPLHATGQGVGKTQLLLALCSDRPLSLLDGMSDRAIDELSLLITGEAKVSGAKLRIGLAAFRIAQ